MYIGGYKADNLRLWESVIVATEFGASSKLRARVNEDPCHPLEMAKLVNQEMDSEDQ